MPWSLHRMWVVSCVLVCFLRSSPWFVRWNSTVFVSPQFYRFATLRQNQLLHFRVWLLMSPTFTLATAKERGNARGDVNKTNSNPNLYLMLGTSGVFRVPFQYMRPTAIIIRRVKLVLKECFTDAWALRGVNTRFFSSGSSMLMRLIWTNQLWLSLLSPAYRREQRK